MASIDNRIEKLKAIYTEFGEFCSRKGNASEADTRVKVIDRILKEVLGWKENQISREDKVSAGFVDYKLSALDKPTLVIEAKREGIYFELPRKLENSRKYKISGALKSSPEVQSAIEQVQRYCVDEGIRYAVVTNGYAWLIFKAIRDGEPWRNGEVLVFSNAKDIMRHIQPVSAPLF
jgi:predicted type IV restriction endonuclease